MARKQWRCFYCDEVFRSEKQARIHFGSAAWGMESTPACKLSVAEGHLVDYIRKLEAELQDHRDENLDVLRAASQLHYEARTLVPAAEQRGYDKGVSEALDMVRNDPSYLDPNYRGMVKSA